MGRKNNDLVMFLIGIAMLVAGGYAFLQNVTVTSGLMSIRWGNFNAGSGLIVIPFIVGIMMLFAMPHKFVSKLVTGLGLLVIVVSVIMGTHFYFNPIPSYAYLLMLVGMFGGLALVLKVLLSDPDRFEEGYEKPARRSRRKDTSYNSSANSTPAAPTATDVDKELEDLKKKYGK